MGGGERGSHGWRSARTSCLFLFRTHGKLFFSFFLALSLFHTLSVSLTLSLSHTTTHTQSVVADQKLQQFVIVPADSAPRTDPTTLPQRIGSALPVPFLSVQRNRFKCGKSPPFTLYILYFSLFLSDLTCLYDGELLSRNETESIILLLLQRLASPHIL